MLSVWVGVCELVGGDVTGASGGLWAGWAWADGAWAANGSSSGFWDKDRPCSSHGVGRG